MNILDNKFFKNIFPAVISAIVALSGNALFSFEFASGSFCAALSLLVLFSLIDIIIIIYYVSKEEKTNQVICESDEEILDEMKKIIKIPGKKCVMSRDLSWVNSEIKTCILDNAKDILIFAEKETVLTKELQQKGADIRYYGIYNFEPKTRFTVIRYNKTNPQVAVANTQNSVRKKSKIHHVIYQTKSNNGTDEWINSLALDMIELCKTICNEDINEQKYQ